MGKVRTYVALDLGAESGRALAGRFDGDRLELEVMHRFPNGPVSVMAGLHWDVLRLWQEIKNGLTQCGRSFSSISSVGVDAWAQDFGLLGQDDVLLGNPYCYRDSRTEGMVEEVFKQVSPAEVYRTTGNSLRYPMVTLCQLLSMVKTHSPALQVARTMLTMPDLFNFWLTGRKVCESTHVINTQCYNPVARTWASDMLAKLSIPRQIFPEVVRAGTVLGKLLPSVAQETGFPEVPVVAPACHDSAAAVVAVPTQVEDYLFISCGTWTVLGTEIDEPYIRPENPPEGLWNEGGARENIRFTSNITGLWIVQECRRQWAAEGDSYSYDELVKMAAQGRPLAALIDPNEPRFMSVGNMPKRVREFCHETGQPVPESKNDILRCVLESLALKYRQSKEVIEAALERKMRIVHMVGGGIQNRLLCQLTADAMRLPVLAGPVESTATGNIIMQAVGLGHLASVEEGRDLIRRSVPIRTYEPEPASAEAWEEAYGRFLAICRAP